MKEYRKKPVIIGAEQWWDFDNPIEGPNISRYLVPQKNGTCKQCDYPLSKHGKCPTLEGFHIVCPGDWIIKGIKGEFYPCKPDIFNETYGEVI